MEKNKEILLSISILMSGREETRKCLDSLVPLMEEVPCELILVDTGCDEEKRAILEEYTNIIVDFEWCNDFAKARNVGLKKATGKWFMFLDDDEWFTDVTPMIEFFNTGKYKDYECAYYKMRNYLCKDGSRYRDFYASRMVKMTKETEFRGSIHEYLYPFTQKSASIETEMSHYGYAYESEKERRIHSQRNVELLIAELEKKPDDLRVAAHLLQEYKCLVEYDLIIDKCDELLDLCDALTKDGKKNPRYISMWLGEIYSELLNAYLKKYEHSNVEETLKKIYADKRVNEMTLLYSYRVEVFVEYDQKKYAETISAFNRYMELYNLLNTEEYKEKIVQQSLLSLGDAKSEQEYRNILFCGVQSAFHMNVDKIVDKYLEEIELDNSLNYIQPNYVNDFVDYVVNKKEVKEKYLKYVEHIIKSDYCLNQLFKYITEMGKVNEEKKDDVEYIENQKKFEKAIKIFSKIDHPHWFFPYMKVLNYKNDGDKEGCIKNIEYIFKCVVDIFNLDNRIWDIAAEVGAGFDSVANDTKYELWVSGVARWIDDTNLEDIEHKAGLVNSWSGATDFRYKYMVTKIKEAYLRYIESADIVFEELEEKIFDYAYSVYSYYKEVYSDVVFEGHTEVLPKECHLAMKLLQVKELRQNNENSKVIEVLRGSINTYESFNEIIKLYAAKMGKYIKEQELKKKENAEDVTDDVSAELAQIAEVLKLKVREFIENGNVVEARVVLNQIIQCVPNDEEAKEILSMIE